MEISSFTLTFSNTHAAFTESKSVLTRPWIERAIAVTNFKNLRFNLCGRILNILLAALNLNDLYLASYCCHCHACLQSVYFYLLLLLSLTVTSLYFFINGFHVVNISIKKYFKNTTKQPDDATNET